MAQPSNNVKIESTDRHRTDLVEVKEVSIRGGLQGLEGSPSSKIYTSLCYLTLRVKYRRCANKLLSKIPRVAEAVAFRSDGGALTFSFEISEEFRIPFKDLGIPKRVRHTQSSFREVESLLFGPLYSSAHEANVVFIFDLHFHDIISQTDFLKLLDIPRHHFDQALGHSLRAELKPHSLHSLVPMEQSLEGIQVSHNVPLEYKAEGRWHRVGHELQVLTVWILHPPCPDLQNPLFSSRVCNDLSPHRADARRNTKQVPTQLNTGSSVQDSNESNSEHGYKVGAADKKMIDSVAEANVAKTLPIGQHLFTLNHTEEVLLKHAESSILSDTSTQLIKGSESMNLSPYFRLDAEPIRVAHSLDASSVASEHPLYLEKSMNSSNHRLACRSRRRYSLPQHKTRRYFRQVSKRSIREGEMISESDDEVHNHWLQQTYQKAISGVADRSTAAKQFFNFWSSHLDDENICGDVFIASALLRFVGRHQSEWKYQDMFRLLWEKVVDLEYNGIVAPPVSSQVFQVIEFVKHKHLLGKTMQSPMSKRAITITPGFQRSVDVRASSTGSTLPNTCPVCGEACHDFSEVMICSHPTCTDSEIHWACYGFNSRPTYDFECCRH